MSDEASIPSRRVQLSAVPQDTMADFEFTHMLILLACEFALTQERGSKLVSLFRLCEAFLVVQ